MCISILSVSIMSVSVVNVSIMSVSVVNVSIMSVSVVNVVAPLNGTNHFAKKWQADQLMALKV